MQINKRGISLIVLVITIIIMIILAAAVVMTLSNTNIIKKVHEGVDTWDLNQVQHLATLAWAEEYLLARDGTMDAPDYEGAVNSALIENGIDPDDYIINATEEGVTVLESTLGNLVKSAADYGKEVNYVSDNGVTGWKVFYKQTVGTEEYVYLIASEKLAYNKVPTILETAYGATIIEETVALSDTESRQVGQIYWKNDSPGITVASNAKEKWLAKWSDYSEATNGRYVSYFLSEDIWSSFKNTTKYIDANGDSYVKGAIGTPTAEMFVESWNEIREVTGNTTKYNIKLELVTLGNYPSGYYVGNRTNGQVGGNVYSQPISTSDPLYVWSTKSNSSVWLASPAGNAPVNLLDVEYSGSIGCGMGSMYNYSDCRGVRPVVCLSSKIPATENASGNIVI